MPLRATSLLVAGDAANRSNAVPRPGRCRNAASDITAWLARLLLILLLPLADSTASSAQTPGEFQPKSRRSLLMDADSGAILFQHNADELASPASMSKLMTLAVLFKALKSGKLKPSDEFVMSANAWRKGGAPSGTAAMFVPVNQKARLEELIQGIIVQSGNDACISIAEGMAGSEEKFAQLMNEEAKVIGLKKSVFRNATGLYHPEHLMTARDLGVLARHIIKTYPEYYPIFAQKEFKYRKHRFINRNPLLFLEIGAEGMKTGFIKEAGYGMVATAKQGERRIIAVVTGLASAEARKGEAMRLIEWGFKNFTEAKLFNSGETIGQVRVWGGDRMFVPVQAKEGDVTIVLPRFPANQRLKAEIVYRGPLKAPVTKGEQVGMLRVTSTSNAVNEVPLFAQEDVKPAGVMRRGLDTIVHMALKWVLL